MEGIDQGSGQNSKYFKQNVHKTQNRRKNKSKSKNEAHRLSKKRGYKYKRMFPESNYVFLGAGDRDNVEMKPASTKTAKISPS